MEQQIQQKNEQEKQNLNESEESLELIEIVSTLTKKQNIFILSLVFLSAFILLSIHWIYANTGNVTLDQLIFLFKVPVKGTNMGMIWDYIIWTFPRIFAIVGITGLAIYFFQKKLNTTLIKKKKILYFASKSVLIASIIVVCSMMNVFGFVKNQITASSFIEEEYVDPFEVSIQFPEEKQNLIYIYLESMESTFSSTKEGGMYEKNRIPELTEIAKNNISFSNTDKMGGAVDLKGTHWTIAAMVSQTAGVPLKISIGDNDYGKHSSFLPGSYTLGEVLEENGYKNYLLIGSESEFGGRKLYFESHGNYDIWDYNSAIEESRMTKEDKVWWGYSDNDLFKYAKEQLTEISKNHEPFNFTMLTVDTHFTDGYKCECCENNFKDQYSNVLQCSSKQVSEFVNWIKEQPFYENTTIIISGDHLTMQQSVEDEANYNKYKERTIYNAIINANANSETQSINTQNRDFFTMDMYPTTLAALGAKIEGNRLGLGTNLFSNEQTIAEKYGVQYVREEIEKKSTFYNKKLIYN